MYNDNKLILKKLEQKSSKILHKHFEQKIKELEEDIEEYTEINNASNDIVIQKKYSNILLASSCLSFPLSLYAYSLNLKKYVLLNILLFLSSINYWRDPRFGFRRNIDIIMVFIHILVNLKTALTMNRFDKRLMYYCALMTAIYFYKKSWDYHETNPLLSTMCHSYIHVICFTGNSFMYYTISGV